MQTARWIFFGILVVLLTPAAARCDERDDANQRQREMEQRLEQADRDRENFSRLHETGNYAAIAYSKSTGKYGYSFDFDNLPDARKRALAQCKATDARIVVWARNGYCALAKGKNGIYGWGYGSTAATAKSHALAECKKRTTDGTILECVFSGR